MGRQIKISAGILNIRLHPHPVGIYGAWIKDIFNRKIRVSIHGDRYGMISYLDEREREKGIISGIITTFTKIEGGSWFDAESLQVATDDKISKVNIPDNLYPNSASFYFVFNTKKHKIFFQNYSSGKQITPSSALKFFSRLSEDVWIMKKYKAAKISIVQEKASLDVLFSLKRIKKIEIVLLKPNTDIFDDDFEENVEKHLDETNSRQISIVYDAEKGESVYPTEELRLIGGVALDNGNVKVTGRNEKGAVTLDSNDYPKIIQDRYDRDKTSEESAFRKLISIFL
ncbi:DUF4747 family protein [Thalassospiraceae bacterium SW-3-3]|nr:DUF4747 family protein [Thalassospiraceae bacterium SW-3-3]